MGVWGGGLYSNDLAMDLRSTIGAVLRLPFDTDQLVEILCGTQPSAANNPADEEHTTFWLVMADQFSRRGIASARVQAKALQIIDGGEDLATLSRLGARPQDLRNREKLLIELRTRFVAQKKETPRKVLREPQPLLMQTGDVLIFPTCNGDNINPYFGSREKNVRWVQSGWGAIVILECGRTFDFLAWYRPATLAEIRTEKPALHSLRGPMLWNLSRPGTCSASHFRKMELEKIGVLPVDPAKAIEVYPRRFRSEVAAAVQDISIANSMKSVPPGSGISNHDGAHRGRCTTLASIDEVL